MGLPPFFSESLLGRHLVALGRAKRFPVALGDWSEAHGSEDPGLFRTQDVDQSGSVSVDLGGSGMIWGSSPAPEVSRGIWGSFKTEDHLLKSEAFERWREAFFLMFFCNE